MFQTTSQSLMHLSDLSMWKFHEIWSLCVKLISCLCWSSGRANQAKQLPVTPGFLNICSYWPFPPSSSSTFLGANAHVSPLIFKLFLQLLAKFVHHATSNKPHVQPNSLTVTVPPTEFQFHPTPTCHIFPFMVTLLVVPNGSSIGHGAPAWIHPPDLEAVGPHGHLRSAPQGHQPCRQRHELMHLADFWKISSSRDFFSEHPPGFRFFGGKISGCWDLGEEKNSCC